jgi:two-component system alkaline phosphatase synthesis response regulator PhoP
VETEIMSRTILVVDDEKRLRDLVKAYLEGEGFRVVTAGDGQEALFVARHEKPDLIIRALMMPVMDGYSFLRAHSKERTTPVIVLTARVEEGDKVLGLELGADDYVTKPFGMRELTARVRAVLRRAQKEAPAPEVLRVADIVLDRDRRLVTVGEHRVDLTPSEFELLATLMSAPGRAFSRLDLLDRLQGTAFEGYERTIDVHVRNLRTKIEPDPSRPRYVETVFGIGYRFADGDLPNA